MTEQVVPTITVVEEPAEQQKSRFGFTKQKAIRVGSAAALAVLGVAYLKRKLNGSASVSADVHVETAEQDNDTNN